MIKQSKISVRHLVEFILRRGSIDNRKKSNHTALEGARIHRKLQKDAGENYEKEVFLKTTVQLDEYYLMNLQSIQDMAMQRRLNRKKGQILFSIVKTT